MLCFPPKKTIKKCVFVEKKFWKHINSENIQFKDSKTVFRKHLSLFFDIRTLTIWNKTEDATFVFTKVVLNCGGYVQKRTFLTVMCNYSNESVIKF